MYVFVITHLRSYLKITQILKFNFNYLTSTVDLLNAFVYKQSPNSLNLNCTINPPVRKEEIIRRDKESTRCTLGELEDRVVNLSGRKIRKGRRDE